MPHKKITRMKNHVNMLDMKKSRTFKKYQAQNIMCNNICLHKVI